MRRLARFIYPDDGGNPLHRGDFNEQVWRPAREAVGLPDVTMHDLRHRFASLLIAAGLSPKVVAKLLGHKDVAMT